MLYRTASLSEPLPKKGKEENKFFMAFFFFQMATAAFICRLCPFIHPPIGPSLAVSIHPSVEYVTSLQKKIAMKIAKKITMKIAMKLVVSRICYVQNYVVSKNLSYVHIFMADWCMWWTNVYSGSMYIAVAGDSASHLCDVWVDRAAVGARGHWFLWGFRFKYIYTSLFLQKNLILPVYLYF